MVLDGRGAGSRNNGVRSKLFHGYFIAAAAFFIILAAFGVRFSYGVFFNSMAGELHLGSAATAAVFSLSMIMEGIFSFIMGGLNDRLGPRKILTISAFLVGLGYCLMPLIHHLWQLYLFYGVILGMGMGGMFVPLVATITRWFTARRSLMTGLVSSGTGLGLIIVSPLAFQLINRFGWRITFLIMGIAIFVIVFTAAQFLKLNPGEMGLSPLGEDATRHKAGTLAPGYTLKEALRTWQFWAVFLVVFLFGFFATSINVHIVPDALDHGMSPTEASYILPVVGALLIIGRITLGLAADRTGNQRVFVLGYILSTLALGLLVVNQAFWAFFVFTGLLGFSQGGIGTTQSPLTASLFGLRSHGSIFGLIGFSFTIGAAAGPFVTGLIFDRTGSYTNAILAGALSSLIALVLACTIRPTRPARTAEAPPSSI